MNFNYDNYHISSVKVSFSVNESVLGKKVEKIQALIPLPRQVSINTKMPSLSKKVRNNILNSRKENVFTAAKDLYVVHNKKNGNTNNNIYSLNVVLYFFIDVFGILNSFRISYPIESFNCNFLFLFNLFYDARVNIRKSLVFWCFQGV